jgi:aminoglycoside phosphotransferase (APT) family kinase protein
MTARRPAKSARQDWEPRLKEQTQAPDRIRAGLQDWMRRRLADPGATIAGMQTPGGTGVANETVIFDIRRTVGVAAGATEGYVARLATPDSLYLDYDLAVHYRMYEAMMAFESVPTPRVLGHEPDARVVGAPFFVMEKIDGAIPTDRPSWAAEGFIVDAEPAQRRRLWERTVRMMAELHRVPAEPFSFLRTGATKSGVGDCLDYWMRSLRWAEPAEPPPLVRECEAWLLDHAPDVTALSWGDSRLPNVIYRDFTPVGLLDWDLASLAGPQADLAWWILMDPPESRQLEGIGTAEELVDLWEEVMGMRASELRWYLVFGAYRMAAIFAKLFAMMVAQGHMTAEARGAQLASGNHVQWMSGLLDLAPPLGVVPRVPDVRLERG